MADLTLALALPVVATPITALAALAKPGATNAIPADPFAMLMAAATPSVPTMPVVATSVAVPLDQSLLPDVAEKSGNDDEDAGQNTDTDTGSDSDALLALLTVPAALPSPVAAQMVAVAQVSAPIATTSLPEAPETTLAAKPVAPLQYPAAPVKSSPPTVVTQTPENPGSMPTTQISIHALAQMMTAQPDAAPAPLQQQARGIAQASADPATPPMTIAAPISGTPVPTAPIAAAPALATDAAPAESAPATPIVAAVPISGAMPTTPALRTIAPKLDRKPTVVVNASKADKTEVASTRTKATEAQPQESAPQKAVSEHSAEVVSPQSQQDAPVRAQEAAATIKTADIGSTDAVVTRHLAVARDGQWLDSLAKDIAATSGNNASLSFTLSPENLGNLKVDILSGIDGASVHMTTDTDATRNIILDAQPKLAAEARAQGLTIKEASVSTNSDSQRQPQAQAQSSFQSSGQQGGQDRRAFAQSQPQQPTAPTPSSPADETSDGELYA